jgi:hypothetical protein
MTCLRAKWEQGLAGEGLRFVTRGVACGSRGVVRKARRKKDEGA